MQAVYPVFISQSQDILCIEIDNLLTHKEKSYTGLSSISTLAASTRIKELLWYRDVKNYV